jgi:hypothetical protein
VNGSAGLHGVISGITVKAHRGQMMRKMEAHSLPDLVTMAAKLGLPTHRTAHRSDIHTTVQES